jgi:8-oxo-dGTP diphosphatase
MKTQIATLCYIKQNGKTLMLHRIKKANDVHEGKWNGLGGKAGPGESPEECARREILEESGLRAHSLDLRGFLTFPEFTPGKDWYVFVFHVHDFDGDLIDSPEGRLAWIPDDEILGLNLWEGDRIFLPWLDGPDFFSGKFEYQDGQLASHAVSFYPRP